MKTEQHNPVHGIRWAMNRPFSLRTHPCGSGSSSCVNSSLLSPGAQAILKRSLKPTTSILPLMKRGHANNLEFFLTHVGKIYMNGSVASPTVISLSNGMGNDNHKKCALKSDIFDENLIVLQL